MNKRMKERKWNNKLLKLTNTWNKEMNKLNKWMYMKKKCIWTN